MDSTSLTFKTTNSAFGDWTVCERFVFSNHLFASNKRSKNKCSLLADKGQQCTEPTLWGPCVEESLRPKKNILSHIIFRPTTQNEILIFYKKKKAQVLLFMSAMRKYKETTKHKYSYSNCKPHCSE